MNFAIIGKHIHLRKIRLSDANNKYLQWLNDKQINQYLETRHKIQTINSIKNFIIDCSKNNSFLMAICKNNTKKHIGNLKVGPINKNHNTADISYFIGDKKEWGKGYATEAVKLSLDYSFNDLKIYKCLAGVYKSNIASSKVLLRAGFKKEATIKNMFNFKSRREDHIIYGISKNHHNV